MSNVKNEAKYKNPLLVAIREQLGAPCSVAVSAV